MRSDTRKTASEPMETSSRETAERPMRFNGVSAITLPRQTMMDEKEESTKVEPLEELPALRRQIEVLEALYARAEQVEGEYALFFTQSLDLLCIAGFDGYFKRLNPVWVTTHPIHKAQTHPTFPGRQRAFRDAGCLTT